MLLLRPSHAFRSLSRDPAISPPSFSFSLSPWRLLDLSPPMHLNRLQLALLGTLSVLLPACGGLESKRGADSGSAALLRLKDVSNGFGQLIPHTVQKLDAAGNPMQQVVSILSQQDLVNYVHAGNPILPVPQFSSTPILPSGAVGNHFLVARFTRDLDLNTIFDPSPGSLANSGLTGAVSVVAIDPVSGTALPVIGRAFVNGQTLGDTLEGDPPRRPLQTWVALDEAGNTIAVDPEGQGFPGTDGFFVGSAQLLGGESFVFVPDADSNLATYETFPVGFEIRMRFTTAVRADNGKALNQQVLACSTVGPDYLSPEVIRTPPPLQDPLITPGGGDIDVDPLTNIRVEFTEPVQPFSVGELQGAAPANLSSALKVEFGPSAARTDMPFNVLPLSPFDLSIYDLIPAFNFPGAGPPFGSCGTFSRVDITINPGQVMDLAQNPDPTDPNNSIPNVNILGGSTYFVTGEGPGMVNAPITPDAIYLGRGGALPGISVLDLNGFGQGTGNPTFIEGQPVEGNTNFPYNANVRFQTGLRPPISVGTCTLDGGSAGVFFLTRDTSMNDQVVAPPIVNNVSDMMLGHSLDGTFNNAKYPFGCLAGDGGAVCTLDGLKIINAQASSGGNTLTPVAPGGFQIGSLMAGYENLVSWAPHPNPPPLSFPPLCVAPYLLGQEPTSVDHFMPPPTGNPKNNLLVPGDPFGDPLANPPVPPTGLLTPEQNAFFLGPTQGQIKVENCFAYMIRQQVGHFLYVLDRQRGEITVLNSNRMTVVERIPMTDPTEFAMSPNLDLLAVTNQNSDTVSFIDIDPASATFHQIVKTTVVGKGPRGIAWQPGNEDILVCNEDDDTLSVISAFSLIERTRVSAQLNKPFDVVAMPRQATFGYLRNVYFAYILNRNGNVALFESGPNGVNGWGYDDVVGIAPYTFNSPKTLQLDPINLFMAVWVAHEGPIDIATGNPGPPGEGALTQLWVESAVTGQLFLTSGNVGQTGLRDMAFGIKVSIGENTQGLSGIPVDIAFDNQRNLGGQANVITSFSAGSALPGNGKGMVRTVGATVNANEPGYMFAAVPNVAGGFGVVDVFDLAKAGVLRKDINAFQPGIQSVQVPNVTGVMDYWSQ